MLMLSILMSHALACDPVDWETSLVWPGEGGSVSADAAPMVHAYNSGHTAMLSLEGPSGRVAAEQRQVNVDGWSDAFRLLPEAPLPPGEYTLVIDVTDRDGPSETATFQVLADTRTVGAVAMRELEATWLRFEAEGDMCDPRSKHIMDLTWSVPDAAEMQIVALSVHSAASADSPIDEAPLSVLSGDRIEDQQTTVSVHTGAEDPTLCLALKSWGVNPDEDAVSEIVCTDPAPPGGGVDGGGVGGCSCSTAGSPLSAAGLLGLIVLGLGRRRTWG